jgi:peptide-methionine (S)-S-oxide reductase
VGKGYLQWEIKESLNVWYNVQMEDKSNKEQIVFGGGCFWCTEAVFKMLKGVESVTPGYTGGNIPNPTYEQVCSGNTGHVESVSIVYDPAQVTLHSLMTVFFGSHDSTTLNRQGNDVGTQYRSAIFCATTEQKTEAEEFIKNLNETKGGDKVVTEVSMLDVFYPAENYHKDYYLNHEYTPYCQIIINPKLEKVQKEFAELLKTNN